MAEYSWLYFTGSTVLTASNGFASQATALNSGLTDAAHTYSGTTGFTIDAGTFLVGMSVIWSTSSAAYRFPYVYDATNNRKYMQSYEDQVVINTAGVTSVRQVFTIPVITSGATVLTPAFYIASSSSTERTLASGNLSRMIVVRVD